VAFSIRSPFSRHRQRLTFSTERQRPVCVCNPPFPEGGNGGRSPLATTAGQPLIPGVLGSSAKKQLVRASTSVLYYILFAPRVECEMQISHANVHWLVLKILKDDWLPSVILIQSTSHNQDVLWHLVWYGFLLNQAWRIQNVMIWPTYKKGPVIFIFQEGTNNFSVGFK
jgi:hypothetical protein